MRIAKFLQLYISLFYLKSILFEQIFDRKLSLGLQFKALGVHDDKFDQVFPDLFLVPASPGLLEFRIGRKFL